MARPVSLPLITLALVAVLLSGCAVTSESTLTRRLAERGAVAVSPENPYLAGNLLLTREMERNAELKGFIEHRGSPSAMAVESGMFSDLTLQLFYLDRGEFFIAEQTGSGSIINGPFEMSAGQRREVGLLAAPHASGEKPPTASAKPAAGEPLPPAVPAPAENDGVALAKANDVGVRSAAASLDAFHMRARAGGAPFQSPPRAKEPAAPERTPEPPTEAANAPAPAETHAQIMARLLESAGDHPAEETPRGDLVHHVASVTETLPIIAGWYTEDPANADRIGRINGLTENPSPGDQIVIPRYLVRNRNRLTDEAVAELSNISVAH